MSMYSFQRWASNVFGPVDSRACQILQAPILVGSIGTVFTPHFCKTGSRVFQSRMASARAHTASEVAHYETRRVHVRLQAILGQKSQEHTENQESACDNCIAGGYGLPTDHRFLWLPKSYGPEKTRRFHACDLSIRYFMPRSYKVLGQSNVREKPVPWEITRHALQVRMMFRRILNCVGAVYPAAED